VEPRLLAVEIDDLQVSVAADLIKSNQPDGRHRLERGLEILLGSGRHGRDLVLDREGITLQAPEVIGVYNDERKKRLSEVSELSALGVDRVEFPRASKISRYHPSLCHQ
jgi:hypothetical protein